MPEIPFLGYIIIEKSVSQYLNRIVSCPSRTLICSGCPKRKPQSLQGSFGPDDNNKRKIDTWIWKKNWKKRCISFSWQAYSWCITFRQLLHHFVCIRQFRSDWLAVRRGKKTLGTAGSQGMNYSRGAQRRNDIVNRRLPPARGATPHSDNHSSYEQSINYNHS